MSLLLKSLRQIDWRPLESPPEDAIAESAVIAPEAECLEEIPAVLDDIFEPELPEETPASAEPQAVEPQAVEPQPVEPQPVEPQAIDEQPAEPQAIELPPPKEPEIQTTESTLDRLNELHELIDAALAEISSTAPIVVESPAGDPSILEPAIASEQLDEEQPTLKFAPLDASPTTVVPPPVVLMPPERPIVPMPAAIPMPANRAPAIRIRDEYRELRDHLLARFRLEEQSTLLAIDAGRVTNDASWLAPFAACLWESLSDEPTRHLSAPPRILLVEAAGVECGIARHLGLDCPEGLTNVLHGQASWATVLERTYHPQIDLLSRGNASLQTKQSGQIAGVWSELKRRYQAILVAAGPWEAPSQASWRKTGMSTASILLPAADAAVVCVQLDGTPQSVAVETKRALERRGIRLLGCIVSGQ